MITLQSNSTSVEDFHLIPRGTPIAEIAERVLQAHYHSRSARFACGRYRGTSISKRDGKYLIVAWQRNVARLQKMDVSLPTILTLELDRNRVIEKVSLHPAFAGSQGICCPHGYLQRMLDKRLHGMSFTPPHRNRMSTEHLHCVHLEEVLQGALSFLDQNEIPDDYDVDELEVCEAMDEGNDVRIVGDHAYKAEMTLHWELSCPDYRPRLQFDKNGAIKSIDELAFEFTCSSSGGQEARCVKTISTGTPESVVTSLLRFTLACWRQVAAQYQCDLTAFHNTNSRPLSLVGLIVQSFGILIFSNNYNYIQHILASLQRDRGIALCIGAVSDIEEAKRCFPDFKLADFHNLEVQEA